MTGPSLFDQFQEEEDLYQQFLADERKTATGRKAQDEESRANLVAQYQESLKNPNLTPEHRQRLQTAIEKNKPRSALGIIEIRRNEDENRGIIENFGRGLGSGVVHGITGLADLAGAVGNAVTPGRPFQGLRDWAKESATAADEVFDPQGGAGVVGDIAGGLVSGAPGYGKIAQLSGGAISRVAPRLAPVVEKALTGNLLQRVTGQALIDAPLNVLQAGTLENASDEDKLKVLALGIAGSAVGGALPVRAKPKGIEDVRIKPGDAEIVAQKPGERLASRAEEIEKLVKAGEEKRATRKAEIETKREISRKAREQWAKDNPGKSWRNDLSQTDRKAYIEQFGGGAEPAAEAGKVAAPGVEVPAVAPVSVEAPKYEAPVITDIKSHVNGDTSYQFELSTGDIVTIKGQPRGKAFYVNSVESTGGRNSVGTRTIREIQATILGMSGTEKLTGYRVFKNKANKDVHAKPQGEPAVENPQQVNQQMLEDLSDLPLHGDPEAIAMAAAQIEQLPPHNKEFLDNVYSKLVKQAKEGKLNPGDATFLQNLQALDIHLFKSRTGREPTIELGAKPAEPAPTHIPAPGTEPGTSTPETPPGPASTPASTPPTEGFLQTVEHDRPVTEIDTMAELDDLKDSVWEQMKIGKKDEIPASDAHRADLDMLARRTMELQQQARTANRGPDPAAPQIVQRTVAAEPAPMSGTEFRKLITSPVKKLGKEQITRLLDELELRTASMASGDKAEYVARMNELRSRLTELTDLPRTEGPLTLYSRGEVGGAVAGFMAGMVTGDTDEERARNALIGGLVGAAAVYGGSKIFVPKAPKSIVPKDVLSIVKNYDEINGIKPETGFMEKARWFYQRAVRPAHGFEHFTRQATGGKTIPAIKDPGKMAASFGRWIAQAEAWITGRPFIEDANGNFIELPVQNAKEIADLVNGDTEGLGKLAAARTALEIYATKGRKTAGIDLVEAQRLAAAMPENYHQAADAMRQLHLGLLESMVQGGILSREAVAKMSQEKFYAALERAFGSASGGSVDKKGPLRIDSPNPVKERTGGSDAPIKNPYETMIANIARTHRAVEINRMKNGLLDLAEANPLIGREAVKRVDRNTRGPDGKPLVSELTEQRVETLKSELDLTTDEAKALVAAYAGDDLNPTAPTMTVYRDGNLRTYRIRRDLAETLRSLRPEELGDIERVLGLATSFARAGIVNNPIFVARQAWRDNWQAMVNSQYGFVWGVDWVRGYLESAFNSKNYKEFVKGGGGSTGFAFRDILSQEKAIQTAKAPGKNTFDTALKRAKELDVREAWHTLIVPVAEAARMGEYLRARGRGADVAEAVYAGKSVVGNFQQHGATLRALSLSALFLNPSIQALDQAAFAAGVHPFRAPTSEGFKFGPYTLMENSLQGRTAAAVNYVTKAVAGITVPSLLLWAAYKDDQEIQELRNSEAGRGFWFYRDSKGELHKSAKPIFEGQLFGTMAELAADKYASDNPVDADAFASAILHDAAVNLLPTIGVVGASLWANKDYNWGGPIGPEGGTPQFQSNTSTTLPARVVAQQLGGVSEWMANYGGNYLTEPVAEALSRAMSPAGIDYVVRNLGGTLAQEALRGIGQAMQYRETGYLPPAVEWPVIRGGLVNYPTTNTASIQKFYRDAERVDRVAIDMASLAQKDPEAAIQYFNQHREEVSLIDLYSKTRRQLADMRQAVRDMKEAPSGTFDPQSIRDIEKEITLRMIDIARMANEATTLLK